jgi:hypothetical protein
MEHRRDEWRSRQQRGGLTDSRVRRVRKQHYRGRGLTVFDDQTPFQDVSTTQGTAQSEQRTNKSFPGNTKSQKTHGISQLPLRPALRSADDTVREQRPINRQPRHPDSRSLHPRHQGSRYQEPWYQQSNYQRARHQGLRFDEPRHLLSHQTSRHQAYPENQNSPAHQMLASTPTPAPPPNQFGSIYSQYMPTWDNLNYNSSFNSYYRPNADNASQYSYMYDQRLRQWSKPSVPISYQQTHWTDPAQFSYYMNPNLDQASQLLQPPPGIAVPGSVKASPDLPLQDYTGENQIPPPAADPHVTSNEDPQRSVNPEAGTRSRRKDYKLPVPILPVPIPSDAYLATSEISSTPSHPPSPKRLLVIIDLNGTLLHRTNGRAAFEPRKNLHKFIEYVLKHHTLMIWSSSIPTNVAAMVGNFLSASQKKQLLTIWARDTLRLSDKQYVQKVQVYKQLSWVWESELAIQQIGSGVVWDQTNTVLIDDSELKAAAEPHNLVKIPEFKGGEEESDVLGQVLGYLQWLSIEPNVSNAIRNQPFKADGFWDWTWTDDEQVSD